MSVPIPFEPSLAVPIFLYLRLELLLAFTSPLATGLSFWVSGALLPFGPEGPEVVTAPTVASPCMLHHSLLILLIPTHTMTKTSFIKLFSIILFICANHPLPVPRLIRLDVSGSCDLGLVTQPSLTSVFSYVRWR